MLLLRTSSGGRETFSTVRTARDHRHAPNAMGNFCFDVTLSYRRLELPRRVTDGA